MRKGRSVVSDRVVGVIVATVLFVLLPAFMVAGALDCVSTNPGLHCAIVQLAFDDAPSSGVAPLRQAKAQ